MDYRRRLGVAVVTVAVLVFSFLQVTGFTDQPTEAEAAVAADFDPGNIISDANFYDGSAMSAPAVQAFLQSANSGCAPGATCILNYSQATPGMSASAYCSAMPASNGQSAAAIIAGVGAACGISPRVLLVLLQKEQSLVTLTAPSASRFEKATGFACPDTAPCDSSFGGFFYQVYYAARQFQVYRANPQNFNHRPGAWNNVLFHPNAACGRSGVFIVNSATAGLYNYTPYQPNAAALANLYGTGDACSTYGNRNFWRMYTDWFGDPRGAGAVNFIRAEGRAEVWLVSGSSRHWVPSEELLLEYGALGRVRVVQQAELARYTQGANLGRLVRAASGTAYLQDNGSKHHWPSCAMVQDYGFDCSAFVVLTDAQLAVLRTGAPMANVVADTSGHNYYVSGSQRREITNPSILLNYGIPSTSVTLTPRGTAHLGVGTPIVQVGDMVAGGNPARVRGVTASGTWELPAGARTAAVGRTAYLMLPESMAQLPARGALPVRGTDGDSGYVLTEQGVTAVPVAQMGQAQLPAVQAGTLATIQRQARITTPFFARELGTSQMYLVSHGSRVPVTEAEKTNIQNTFGVPGDLHETFAGVLEGIPERSNFAAGTTIRAQSKPEVYVVDGDKLMHLSAWWLARDLGIRVPEQQVSLSIVNGFPPSNTSLRTPVISCGGQTYVGIGGKLHTVSTANLAHLPFAATPVSAALCAALPKANESLTRFVTDSSGKIWYLENGKRRYVTSIEALVALPGYDSPRPRASAEFLAAVPVGDDIVARPTSGTMIWSSNAPEVYLIDGARLLHVTNLDITEALGYGRTYRQVPPSLIASYQDRSTKLNTVAVTCNSRAYLGIGGQLRPYASSAVEAQWNVTEIALGAGACGRLNMSTASIGQFFQSQDGAIWYVQNGQRRHITNMAAFQRLGGPSSVDRIDWTIWSLLPVGAPIY